MKRIRDGYTGLKTLPAFPVVLVTIGENILTAAAFSFYSFDSVRYDWHQTSQVFL